MRWVIGGAGCRGHRTRRALGLGQAGACPLLLPPGAAGVPGLRAGPQGRRRRRCVSSLEAGGAAPYPVRGASPGPGAAALLEVSGGAAASFWSWRPRSGRGGLVLAGSVPGPVALAVRQQVVTGVEDPVQDGFADDCVGEQRVPVGRAAVG